MRAIGMLLICFLLVSAACSPAEKSLANSPVTSPGGELFCMADNQQEAEEIAALYGIELASVEWGVAVFRTEEDPEAVMERGRQNGWPVLNLNSEKQLME